jgi:hypothetical protein
MWTGASLGQRDFRGQLDALQGLLDMLDRQFTEDSDADLRDKATELRKRTLDLMREIEEDAARPAAAPRLGRRKRRRARKRAP